MQGHVQSRATAERFSELSRLLPRFSDEPRDIVQSSHRTSHRLDDLMQHNTRLRVLSLSWCGIFCCTLAKRLRSAGEFSKPSSTSQLVNLVGLAQSPPRLAGQGRQGLLLAAAPVAVALAHTDWEERLGYWCNLEQVLVHYLADVRNSEFLSKDAHRCPASVMWAVCLHHHPTLLHSADGSARRHHARLLSLR